MSTSVETLVGTWATAVGYPVLDTRLIEAIFPTNVWVNTLNYVNIAAQPSGAYTFIMETVPGTVPTLDIFQEDGNISLDSTPVAATTVQTDFWALGFDLPQAVIEDIPYSVMNQYTKRLMLKAAYTRDKHVEQTLNTFITATSAVAGTSYGFGTGTISIAGVLGTTDIAKAVKTISKNNVEANTCIMPSLNAADLFQNPLLTSSFFYDRPEQISDNIAMMKQSVAPVGNIRGCDVWASNVTTAGDCYFLAVGTEGVVPNNQYSQLGIFVDKRPPMSKDYYWADDDSFKVRLSTRFKAKGQRAFHGYLLTSLNTS
jgi:hypothetical protein